MQRDLEKDIYLKVLVGPKTGIWTNHESWWRRCYVDENFWAKKFVISNIFHCSVYNLFSELTTSYCTVIKVFQNYLKVITVPFTHYRP
jgi:hypothetical protein